MIVVTGAAGFIGSCLVHELNSRGISDIILVDQFESSDKWKNLRSAKFLDFIPTSKFLESSELHNAKFIFHLGACSSTTELDMDFLWENNVHYSQKIFEACSRSKIPLIYASSAATYGDGELGYSDDHKTIQGLLPLNPYGWSKQVFDQWALKQKKTPPFFAGIKFFNVYGPNEGHKGDMKSLVNKAYYQIKDSQKVRLFKSHRDDFNDGEQLRDFIYVKDAVKLLCEFMNKKFPKNKSGIYNLGTGKAHTFKELVLAVFEAMEIAPQIVYIDMPENIKSQYQYYTQAKMDKISKLFPKFKFTPLKKSVSDYVNGHLIRKEGHY